MNDDNAQKDLHLIYTTSVEDIKFAKLQQWRITYYALILMAGIFYIRSFYQLHCYWNIFLIASTLLIAFVALVLLYKIENDILRYRKRMVETQNGLSKEFKNTFKFDKKYLETWNIRKLSIPKYKFGFLLVLTTTILVAAIIFSLITPNLKG